MNLKKSKQHRHTILINIHGKKFSDDKPGEVLSKIKKFDADGICFVYIKNSAKKNFVKIKIKEFELKDISAFFDENMLVQRIPFDGKSGFHDLTLYRISDKDRYLITRFTCESDDWNKDIYPSNVSCENCGHSYEIRVACSDCKNLDQISIGLGPCCT